MVTKIKQFIIDQDSNIFTDEANWSKNLLNKNTWGNANSGELDYTITHLGINALPGTKFTIEDRDNEANATAGDGSTSKEADTFIINNLGVFQLDVSEFPITHLHLARESFELLKETLGHYIIIDLVYREATVNNEQ